ncbi:hypothetical protein EVAR_68567_1 [Eumeta japonica]|uniref:Uncharacterized protein n=1 Tax=Eumeta variegata TaxID=151549 RepID=A0A4C1SUV3_EUMVA|nr:hypothetical protein EVAR_68567_1 [Eumeta japonica]
MNEKTIEHAIMTVAALKRIAGLKENAADKMTSRLFCGKTSLNGLPAVSYYIWRQSEPAWFASEVNYEYFKSGASVVNSVVLESEARNGSRHNLTADKISVVSRKRSRCKQKHDKMRKFKEEQNDDDLCPLKKNLKTRVHGSGAPDDGAPEGDRSLGFRRVRDHLFNDLREDRPVITVNC